MDTTAVEVEVMTPDVRVDRVRLQQVMNLRGFTNKSLAEAMDKHYNSILRLKREQSLPIAEMGRLCAVLNCHPFDLIVAEGFPEPFSLAPASH